MSLFFISGCATSNKLEKTDTSQIKVQENIQIAKKNKVNKDSAENEIDQRREEIMARIISLEKKTLTKKRKKFSQTIDSLMWEDNIQVTSVKRTWHNAKNYCKNSVFLNYTNWYLPSSKQLLALYKNKHRLKYKDTSHYWSSSFTKSKTFAWKISFDSLSIGAFKNYEQRKYKFKVRCVRAVQ